jgi:unsaturated rhamnogalacturonyl hydrolase
MVMKYKKKLWVFFAMVALAVPAFAQEEPVSKNVIVQMEKVADWQLAQKWPTKRLANGKLVMGPKTWESGAFYPGILDMYRVSGDKKYLNAVIELARSNNYEHGAETRNADDQAILQTYLELYEFDKNPRYLEAAKRVIDSVMHDPMPGDKEYTWCDLMFMGPPLWSRYAKVTGNKKYLDYQDKIYWEALGNFQDATYRLFYRDFRFKTMQAENKPIFWSRGNGWVVAGLVRFMEYMPQDYKDRKKYEDLLVSIAAALKPLQQKDGFWKSNLLLPDLYPKGETSGTAFFCYGIAWGINHGILDRKEYLPVVQNAWNALVAAIHPDGKLGYVQPGGDRPNNPDYEMSNWYSAGGFLMAGKQVLQLN